MRKIGILDLLKRRVSESSFEVEDLERIFETWYLKSLAVDKAAEFIARVFAKSEFRYLVLGKNQATAWDYVLNVRPNRNQTATEFWQSVIYRLLTKNEVLIIQSDDEQLLLADSYTRQKSALNDDRFDGVTVGEFTYRRTFYMTDVIFLQYNNNRLQEYIVGLFEDYNKMHGQMVAAIARNNQIRGILSTKTNAGFNNDLLAKMQNYADKLFKSFGSRSVAIVPAIDGIEYSELTNTRGTQVMSVDELKKLRQQFDDEVADILGIPPALLSGDIANLSHSRELFVHYSFQTMVKKVEDGLNFALLSPSDVRAGKSFVIIGEGRKDVFKLAESVDKLISSGAMTRNEVRSELGLEPVADGDKFIMTKNYQEAVEKGGETDNGENSD